VTNPAVPRPASPPPKAGAERFRRVIELFERALPLPQVAREELLSAECAADRGLRDEVEAMLAHAVATRGPLEAGGGLEALLHSPLAALAPAAPPVLSGQYRILRTIGEGGMGVVYEAEQAIPRRRVALKAIRAGFASRQMLARFVHEAHILGRLHHTGIAQIYEAGAAEPERADQAWFAMEFVDGDTLIEHARRRSLDARAKAVLMIKVCDAVQHAHERGVIHRDLKPGNILVDRSGQPKVLDFGIARMEGEGLGLATETREGQLLGTLAYMSPEQAFGGPREIDTRSDVYALGVVLYELFSGALPYSVLGKSLPQILIAIRDEEAPKLSAARPGCGRDLEAIVETALAKDKRRRYASARELGLDLARWLDGAPIEARGDSAVYVIRKQVVRHRWTAALILAALLGLVAFAVEARIRTEHERRANRELAEALGRSNVERAKLLTLGGSFASAEDLLWREELARPRPHSHWALSELYARFPCSRAFGETGGAVLGLARDPSGRFAAAVSHDDLVRVYEVATGKVVARLPGAGGLGSVLFAGQGRVCACAGGTLRVLDVAGSREQGSLALELPSAIRLACTADGALAAVSRSDGRIALVDLAACALLRDLDGPRGGAVALAFDAAGGRLFAAGTSAVDVLEPASGRRVAEVPLAKRPTFLAVSADGSVLATSDEAGAVALVDLETLAAAAPAVRVGTVRSLAFDPAGRRLLVAGSDAVEIWNLAAGSAPVIEARLAESSTAAQFGADAGSVVLAESGGPLRVWEPKASALVSSAKLELPRGKSISFARERPYAAWEEDDGAVEVRDLEHASTLVRIAGQETPIHSLTFDAPAGRLVTATLDGTVRLFELPSGREAWTHHESAEVAGVRFTPDLSQFCFSTSAGELVLLDASSGALVRRFSAGLPYALRLGFRSDGARVASTHENRIVQVWDVATGAALARIEPAQGIWSLVYLPGKDELVLGTRAGAIELRDGTSGVLLRTWSGHARLVNAISCADDGRRFATCSLDGTVSLWDADEGEPLAMLEGVGEATTNVLLARDGQSLSCVRADGVLHRWDLAFFERFLSGNEVWQRARLGL
jgi:WD40 repeat protein/tRNA A-37 threonylcarbamoyl transferase component Bud32